MVSRSRSLSTVIPDGSGAQRSDDPGPRGPGAYCAAVLSPRCNPWVPGLRAATLCYARDDGGGTVDWIMTC